MISAGQPRLAGDRGQPGPVCQWSQPDV